MIHHLSKKDLAHFSQWFSGVQWLWVCHWVDMHIHRGAVFWYTICCNGILRTRRWLWYLRREHHFIETNAWRLSDEQLVLHDCREACKTKWKFHNIRCSLQLQNLKDSHILSPSHRNKAMHQLFYSIRLWQNIRLLCRSDASWNTDWNNLIQQNSYLQG